MPAPLPISPGDIVYITTVPYTNHPKYHLALSIKDDLFFIINSGVNNFISLNPELARCQIPLTKTPDNLYMVKETSYIACHEIADIFSQDIITKIKNGQAEVKGRLDLTTIQLIIDVLTNSCPSTLAPRERNLIVQNLKSIL